MNHSKSLILSCMTALCLLAGPALAPAQTALDSKAITALHGSNVPALAIWFANGGNINQATEEGNTLLIMAAKIGDRPTLDFLLSQRPNVDFRNKAGATALMIAAKYGHMHVVDMLLESGADPTIRTHHGITAARFALAYDNPEVYQKLIEAEGMARTGS